jgi:aminopeptidase N
MNIVLEESTKADIHRNIEMNLQWYASSNLLSLEEYLNEMFAEENQYRLPKTSEPTSYDISLDLRNVQNGDLTYEGTVTIHASITQATNKIIIHSKDQEINSLVVLNENGNIINYSLYHLRSDMETLIIYFSEQMNPQDLQIIIKYTTELLTEIDGLYQDFYYRDNEPDRKIYLATTQFQAIEARRAFPCYDGKI